MKNKGFVIGLTIIITLLCVYYLSFTFVSQRVVEDANTYATSEDGTIDFAKKQRYLDSVWTNPVYNLLGLSYTYKEVKDTELSLGLDLQGGMHVTLEVSPVEIIRTLSGNSTNENFLKAIENAREAQASSQASFIDLFYQEYQQLTDEPLADIFANANNRQRINFESPDDEVLDMLREEMKGAIDRSFNILRNRIDRFGTSQPNIQQLQGTGRIQIELPGVENPERVRNLLSGVAKLEFWEVVEIPELEASLLSINQKLVEEQNAEKVLGTDSGEPAAAADDLTSLLTEEEDVTSLTAENDTTSLDTTLAEADTTGFDSLANQQASPLLGLLQSQFGLVYRLEDTAKINNIFERPDIRNLMPRNVKMLWQTKPMVTDNGVELLEIYAVRTSRTGEPALAGDVVTDARQDFDQRGAPSVSMQMNADGAKAWRQITRDNIGERIAIVLDDRVLTAPRVNVEIPNGQSVIEGDFSLEEAKDLANLLKAGSLPAPTRIVEEAIIGPTLGKLAQRQGIVSIIAGLGIVIIFMVFYYNKSGFVANIALAFNIFFILGILAQLNAALTLPGIAGIVLTIGMSIDANVLIFERIREELAAGVQLRRAITNGYQKAYSSIIDANITTFLTGVIMYYFGQGPVKGFAITLIIGIACSFFSAVYITRVIIEWWTRKGDDTKLNFTTVLSKNVLRNINLDFLSRRRIAYIVSSTIIVIGMGLLIAQGGLNLGVDFVGGRSYVLTFDQAVVPSELKTSLSDKFDQTGVEVKTYGANNVVKVTTSYLVDDESAEADETVQTALIEGVSEFTGASFIANAREVDSGQFTISSSSKVGATIADDIKNASVTAIIYSLILIFIYIVIRFRRWQFGLGALVALFHDVLITLSAFSIARALGLSFEFDQVIIAAMLTIIGYSINDTVIVFDRIRESIHDKFSKDLKEIINVSVNRTISRTLITSGTTLFVIIVLFLFGGEVLRGFSFALLIGILVGTYSSIYIASPVVIDLNKKKTIQ